MELIDQRTKSIMEGCKERAREVGLSFQDESLEYIVSNRDLLELSPKGMIPTLYDYWVHDVEVIREKGKYELYPHNPYETVINTRPAISFYNDNNPDWLNVMIFYHVLAHVDFFQNNLYFRHTWDYDFAGQALSDKRVIAKLRAEHGRWVDYAIEFARGVDNLLQFHGELDRRHAVPNLNGSKRLDYYFDVFLQAVKKVRVSEYIKEIERHNDFRRRYGAKGESLFFADVERQNPEFRSLFQKSRRQRPPRRQDVLEFLMEHSPFLAREENKWMQTVLQVVRTTSLFFQPQIRTKIMNEGWASYWHEKLFLQDDRIRGHEVDFARVHAMVTAVPRVGMNPYALGMRLFQHIESTADRGRYSIAYGRLADVHERKIYDEGGDGRALIFQLRADLNDFLFLNRFVDQEFINRHRLFVTGRRLNQQRQVWEYYVKSRKVEDYRQMLLEALYHPPHVTIDSEKGNEETLYLVHHFEGKPLVREYIAGVLLGLEYLWGDRVQLETSEPVEEERADSGSPQSADDEEEEAPLEWQRVLYTMKNRKLARQVLS